MSRGGLTGTADGLFGRAERIREVNLFINNTQHPHYSYLSKFTGLAVTVSRDRKLTVNMVRTKVRSKEPMKRTAGIVELNQFLYSEKVSSPTRLIPLLNASFIRAYKNSYLL
jgi:hypothetical protein